MNALQEKTGELLDLREQLESLLILSLGKVIRESETRKFRNLPAAYLANGMMWQINKNWCNHWFMERLQGAVMIGIALDEENRGCYLLCRTKNEESVRAIRTSCLPDEVLRNFVEAFPVFVFEKKKETEEEDRTKKEKSERKKTKETEKITEETERNQESIKEEAGRAESAEAQTKETAQETKQQETGETAGDTPKEQEPAKEERVQEQKTEEDRAEAARPTIRMAQGPIEPDEDIFG